MYATSTVVEVDNRYTRQRFKIIVALPRHEILTNLQKCLAPLDEQRWEVEPLEACVIVAPCGAIRVVIFPTGSSNAIDRDCEPLDDRTGEAAVELHEPAKDIINNLADNVARLMSRQGIDVDTLAASAGVDANWLDEILRKESEATLTEVCLLADYFGIAVSELVAPPKDEGARGWN